MIKVATHRSPDHLLIQGGSSCIDKADWYSIFRFNRSQIIHAEVLQGSRFHYHVLTIELTKLHGRTSSLFCPEYPPAITYVNAGVDHVRKTITHANPTILFHSSGCFFPFPSNHLPGPPPINLGNLILGILRQAPCTPSSIMIPRTCARKYLNALRER